MKRSTVPSNVVVTGATAGVGRATAIAFARLGANVGLLARDEEALNDVARQIRALGVSAMPVVLDVSDSRAMERAAARIEEELGPIDVWVNNAMLTMFAPLAGMTPDEFARVTNVTYLGFVWGTMSALRRMIPRDRGTIVQVGSALAYRSIPLQSAYCGAKHAIRGFTDALRCELLHARSRVHVTMVQMPALNTPQFDWAETRLARSPRPVAPIFQPEVAARAIVWAATHRRRELYVGWPSMKAIIANKFVATWLDHYLARTGFESQEDASVATDGRPSNLWKPVTGLHRVHGRFDNEATDSSPFLWLATHRHVVMAGTVTLALSAAAIVALLRARPRSRG